MGVCTSNQLTALSVQPTGTPSLAKHLKPRLVVNSKRQTVPLLGPIACSPLATRRAQMQIGLVSPRKEEETRIGAVGSSGEAE